MFDQIEIHMDTDGQTHHMRSVWPHGCDITGQGYSNGQAVTNAADLAKSELLAWYQLQGGRVINDQLTIWDYQTGQLAATPTRTWFQFSYLINIKPNTLVLPGCQFLAPGDAIKRIGPTFGARLDGPCRYAGAVGNKILFETELEHPFPAGPAFLCLFHHQGNLIQITNKNTERIIDGQFLERQP